MPPGDHSRAVAASVLRRDRATLLTAAVLLVIAAAAWILVLASSMHMADDAAMEQMHGSGVAFVAAWAAMMTAMMLPSALPMIALYGAVQRRATQGEIKGAPVAIFTLVYLGVWAATGIPVYLLSMLLEDVAPGAVAYGVAAVLVVAGLYQLSPLKQACLRTCRTPLGFLLGRWRAGYRGSLALGWTHALYCVGCCWSLMVVLVAAGAMGLPWVLLIAAVVAAEKVMPGGEWVARAAGGALLLLAVGVAAHPDLVETLRGGHAM